MLLTLPFPSTVHDLQENQTLMLSHHEFLKITVTDRHKDGQRQTCGRTDVHQDTQTDNRRKSRDRAGDKDGGAEYCTLRRVLLWWWVGGCVVLLFVLCGNPFFESTWNKIQ